MWLIARETALLRHSAVIPMKTFLPDATVGVLSTVCQMKPLIQTPFVLTAQMRHAQAAAVPLENVSQIRSLKHLPWKVTTILPMATLPLPAVPLTRLSAPAAHPDANVEECGGVKNQWSDGFENSNTQANEPV